MNKINSNNNVSFGTLHATPEGARKLVNTFKNNNMKLLKKLVTLSKKNIAADIFVKENEILVTPHKLTNYAPMRMRDAEIKKYWGSDYYKVDYFEYGIYPSAKNAYYTINNHLSKELPLIEEDLNISRFGKLFVGACHIAEDLNQSFHNKILEAMNKEKQLDKTIKDLGIDIIE